MQGTAKAILLRPRPHPFPRQQPKKPSRGETPEAPQSTAGRSDAWEHPKRAKGGRADPPRGEKTSLAKVVGGERGNIGQTKINSKGEKEREQLMEPEETVTALKIRERVRSKKEGEENRSWKDRRVEAEIREKGGSSQVDTSSLVLSPLVVLEDCRGFVDWVLPSTVFRVRFMTCGNDRLLGFPCLWGQPFPSHRLW